MRGEVGRREFLRLLGAAGVLAACSSKSSPAPTRPASSTTSVSTALPPPATAPFDTVVVVTMENRSFDHYLGWLPGADGRQTGLRYPDQHGTLRATHALAPDFQGCAFHDPRHDWQSVATQFNNGKCDGWLRTQDIGDTFPIGYYTAADLPVTAALARGHTVCDRYHCSVLGPTGPNRMYMWSATTDYLAGPPGPMTVDGPRPSNIELTIFDRFQAAGISAAYYAGKEPQSYSYKSKKYDALTKSHAEFFDRARAGTLPHFSFLDPDLDSIAEFFGTGTDDHPYNDVRRGEAWIGEVYRALAASPQWDRLVLIVTFDEHGGFFDHVVPPFVADDTVLHGPGPDFKRMGFRVPCIIGGPFAPARVAHHGPFEHCSILRMVEWRWGLEPMTARDRHAQNLAEALDFSASVAPVTLAALPEIKTTACPDSTRVAHAQP
ncbi:MAG TPA: alkaline phosphatase family protein [Acidimicrobiia bacterium]|nr:alkaline phosphatase family protein [Acidimicrobiia bacterium]